MKHEARVEGHPRDHPLGCEQHLGELASQQPEAEGGGGNEGRAGQGPAQGLRDLEIADGIGRDGGHRA
ncbi:MAG: hypothetical protein ACK55I_38175, partial [bacterium]